MIITTEISYYPLDGDTNTQILRFIEVLEKYPKIKIETGKMSSLVIGEYDDVMKALTESMQVMMQETASAFNIKISNACPV